MSISKQDVSVACVLDTATPWVRKYCFVETYPPKARYA